MKKPALAVIMTLIFAGIAQASFYPESILGFDVPVQHWGREADFYFMGGDTYGVIGIPSDLAVLRIATQIDTTVQSLQR